MHWAVAYLKVLSYDGTIGVALGWARKARLHLIGVAVRKPERSVRLLMSFFGRYT